MKEASAEGLKSWNMLKTPAAGGVEFLATGVMKRSSKK